MKPITFALFFGNRGFFPEALIAGARQQIQARLEKLGYRTLAMPVSATPFGAVESVADGVKYAALLAEKRGLAVYFIIRKGEGFETRHTPGFDAYLKLD